VAPENGLDQGRQWQKAPGSDADTRSQDYVIRDSLNSYRAGICTSVRTCHRTSKRTPDLPQKLRLLDWLIFIPVRARTNLAVYRAELVNPCCGMVGANIVCNAGILT
jgi:hypothetical protein